MGGLSTIGCKHCELLLLLHLNLLRILDLVLIALNQTATVASMIYGVFLGQRLPVLGSLLLLLLLENISVFGLCEALEWSKSFQSCVDLVSLQNR